jgi:hypothetical protein
MSCRFLPLSASETESTEFHKEGIACHLENEITNTSESIKFYIECLVGDHMDGVCPRRPLNRVSLTDYISCGDQSKPTKSRVWVSWVGGCRAQTICDHQH